MTMNFITGLVAIAVGGIYLVTALLLPNMTMGDRLGPKLFPTILGVIAILAGLILCIGDKRPGKASKKPDFAFAARKDIWIKILLCTAVGIVYGLVIDSVGFLLSTTVFMLFITMLINKGRIGQNVIVALSFTILSYLIFGVALKLSLPRGIIESALPF